jgi:asparagine synthase (glutamine-hydrolysing)
VSGGLQLLDLVTSTAGLGEMCGICGEVAFNDDAVGSAVAAMTEQMRPRGPDAGGTFTQNHVALGHRRLSIIDLAAAS